MRKNKKTWDKPLSNGHFFEVSQWCPLQRGFTVILFQCLDPYEKNYDITDVPDSRCGSCFKDSKCGCHLITGLYSCACKRGFYGVGNVCKRKKFFPIQLSRISILWCARRTVFFKISQKNVKVESLLVKKWFWLFSLNLTEFLQTYRDSTRWE